MTSIQGLVKRIKGWSAPRLPNLRVIPGDLFLGFIMILVAFGSFGLGRLSKIEGSKTPIRIENAPKITTGTFPGEIKANTENSAFLGAQNSEATELTGSKNGSKYYYPWCTGSQKIAEANRIYFTSKTDAEARGYTPSATCKGL